MEDSLVPKMEQISINTGCRVLEDGCFGRTIEVTQEVIEEKCLLRNDNLKEEEAILVHPNVVKLHCESNSDFRYELKSCVASLDQLFLKTDDSRKYKGPMPHHIEVLIQLASGLEHIHSKNLIHGDIKPENVLIFVEPTGQEKITLKWTNFGLTRKVHENGKRLRSKVERNNVWLAPELLLKLVSNGQENEYQGTVQSDVFALGLVFGSLLLKGEHLYGSTENENEISGNIIKKYPINMQKMDHTLRDCYGDKIFKKILEYDPNKRMTSTEVVNQLKSIKDKLIGNPGGEIFFYRDVIFGSGRYGCVFKGNYAGREVAVKRVELRYVNEREEEAMKKLDHPNVVKLFHSESNVDFRMYALELCDASLDQLFLKSDDPKKYNGPMPRHFEVLVQLALGLEHIHSKKLIHRDIKPNNVLISTTTTSQGVEVTIKWADFGLSKQVNERGTCTLSGVRGNKQWLAPEILRRILQADNDERGNVKSDVFALGLVFGYYFLKGEHLYGSSEKEIHDNIIGKKPINMEKIDDELREIYEDDLFKKMLENEPSKRMTSKEVVLQLESIKEKLAEKEDKLRDLCARGYHSDLTEKIKKMIRYGIDLNAKDEDGFNALHLLCKNNSSRHLVDAIKVLIELGIDKDAKTDKDGLTALHLLCGFTSSQHLVDAIKVLIKLGIDKDSKTKNGWSALHVLCANNSNQHLVDAIKVLIKLGIDKDAKEEYGWNALHVLCAQNSSQHLVDAIKVLIELGIDKDAKNNDGWSALHVLCAQNLSQLLVEAFKFLIKHGIDKDAKNNDGWSALHFLCAKNSSQHLVDAIKVLIEHGIGKDAKDEDEWNALLHLCTHNSSQHLVEAIKVLIELGIDKDAKTDEGGWTALHLLCRFNLSQHLIDAIKVLIELGIDKDAKEKNGRNALHLLCAHNSSQHLVDAIKVLIELGIDKDAKTDKDESTALHLLCAQNSSQFLVDAIKVLIELGIDKDSKTKNEWTALHVLCANNSSQLLVEAIKFLIKLGIDKDAKTDKGLNALHLLCANDSSQHLVDAIKVLIELGIDVNEKDNEGLNALHHLSSKNGSPNLVGAMKLLIELDIEVNAKTNSGRTALDMLPPDSNDASQYLKNAIHTHSD